MILLDMEMPKSCEDCNIMGLRDFLECNLIFSGCANCGRHPNCPIKAEIPKNVTNGDVIKAMLNPYKICEYEYSVHIYMTEKDFWKSDYLMNCSARWWNAPWKG